MHEFSTNDTNSELPVTSYQLPITGNQDANPQDGEATETAIMSLKDKILDLVEQEIEQVVSFHTAEANEKNWNLEEIYEVMNTIFPVPKEVRLKLDEIQLEAGDATHDVQARDKIIQYLIGLARKEYDNLEERIIKSYNPSYQPASSADRLPVTSDSSIMRQIEKTIMLRAIDMLWVEHLEAMDQMKTGIGLRGYGQRDPLVEYKKEAFGMFNELLNGIQKQVAYSIYKVGLMPNVAEQSSAPRNLRLSGAAKTMEKDGRQGALTAASSQAEDSVENIKSMPRDASGHKVGRNDPCPCGSGKKYKKCCGK